jgi:hypothetical protein
MAKAKTQEEVLVCGVDMSKVDAATVRGSAQVLLPSPARDAKALKDLVTALFDHFVAKTDKKKLVKCLVCGGASDMDLESCPYCGDTGEVVQDAPMQVEVSIVKATPEQPVLSAIVSKVEEVVVAADQEGIVGIDETPSEDLLDRVTDRVHEMQNRFQAAWWDLGRQIRVVLDRELWKLRTNDVGKPSYESFDQYVIAELRMKRAQDAYNVMDLAAKFTKADAVRYGITKLQYVLRAPEGAQAQMLESANVVGVRELRQQLQAVKEEAGMKKRQTGRKEMPVGKPGRKSQKGAGESWQADATKADATKDEQEGKITIAMVEGTIKIPFYAKPKKGDKKGDVRPAKKVQDEPVAREELENSVVRLYYVSQNPKGELVLTIETKRG